MLYQLSYASRFEVERETGIGPAANSAEFSICRLSVLLNRVMGATAGMQFGPGAGRCACCLRGTARNVHFAVRSHSRTFSTTPSTSAAVSSGNMGSETQQAALRSELGMGPAMRAGLPQG